MLRRLFMRRLQLGHAWWAASWPREAVRPASGGLLALPGQAPAAAPVTRPGRVCALPARMHVFIGGNWADWRSWAAYHSTLAGRNQTSLVHVGRRCRI
jgi:hypothetical protein